MKNPLKYARKDIIELSPYSTARDEHEGRIGIFLDANENPYENNYNRYPDPYQRELKWRISTLKRVPQECVFVGNGSDEAIDLCYRVFCRSGVDSAVAISPTYGMYKVSADINGCIYTEVPLENDFSLDTDRLLEACGPSVKLLFICSPNNPTGNSFPAEQITDIASRFDGMVVLDEAYIDFSGQQSLSGKLEEIPNLIILQTFSKAWGMAGLRIGLALAAPQVIELFTKVKYPYNINGLIQQTVLARLDKDIWPQLTELVSERAKLAAALEMSPFITRVYPSDANFILVKTTDAPAIYKQLLAEGVIVRDRSKARGCEGCLRIMVGTPAENRKLIELINTLRL